jgi:hypothetical protein
VVAVPRSLTLLSLLVVAPSFSLAAESIAVSRWCANTGESAS